jgi:hypothetical protein
MKLYVLNDSCEIVFEFDDTSGGYRLKTSTDDKVKVLSIIKAAFKFLLQNLP